MKRIILSILIFLVVFPITRCESQEGNKIYLQTQKGGQIIADHTAVAAFDNIPSNWIDSVKTMMMSYPGESHAVSIIIGLNALEALDANYQVVGKLAPVAYTDEYLRVALGFWGNESSPTGWVGSLGEEDWYLTETAIARTKAGIVYINETNETPLDVFGFGWCYDPLETASEMADYVSATQEYIDLCTTNKYITNVIFTTGPVDAENATGEQGWNKHLAFEAIRDSVTNDETRILFDFADILCYDNDGSGPNTATWDGNTYPIITTTNLGGADVAHMSNVACLRLGKAMWWMLARIAGWDGSVATSSEEVAEVVDPAVVTVVGEELRVEMKGQANLPNRISIHNLLGGTVSHKDNPGSTCSFSTARLPAGIYLVVISGTEINWTKKIFIQ